MNQPAVISIAIQKADKDRIIAADDVLAMEEPLEIGVEYTSGGTSIRKSISVTMRTPGRDQELGCGFLFTEGIIQAKEQIMDIESRASDNKVSVRLQEGVEPLLSGTDRNFYTTSSCGVCGKASIEAIRTVVPFAPANDTIGVPLAMLYRLPSLLRAQQEIFNSTGGLHASALFDLDGNFLTLQEDVGRHNALDKVIGAALLADQLPLSHVILLLSGRASFELIQKAAMAGIRIIAAVGAPSSLAVSLAAKHDITLVGFLRDNRCNIYTGAHRIQHT